MIGLTLNLDYLLFLLFKRSNCFKRGRFT